MQVRLALFDFDGTLADSFRFFAGMLDQLALRFDFARLSPDELEEMRGLDAKAILRRLRIPLWKVAPIAAHMRSLIAARSHEMQLFPGIPEALRGLHARGVELGIVSSNAEPTIRRILGPETAALIAQYECGASLFGKPAKLKKVLRRSGIPAADALYVGDELRDGDAARAVGMRFGAVSWGYNRPDALAARAPDELFTSTDDLLAKLT